MPNSRRCCPIPQRGEWKSSFSKCRTRNRYVSAQCTFFHSWNKVVRGREMVPLIEELFSSIRRQRRETDDRSCVPVRFFLYFSFFVSFFAYLFEGSSPKLSVKIRDHQCWRGWRVFDAERMEGKHWREKKKKKMRSKPHECMRMCVIVGKSDWTRVHARKDHERETWTYGTTLTGPTLAFFYILSTACILLACLPVSYTFLASIVIDYF